MTKGNIMNFKSKQQMIEKESENFALYTTKIMASFLKTTSQEVAFNEAAKKDLKENSILLLQTLKRLSEVSNIDGAEIEHELQERMHLSNKLLKKGIRARKGGSYRSTKLP